MTNRGTLRTVLIGALAAVLVAVMALLAFGKLGNGTSTPIILRGVVVANGQPVNGTRLQIGARPVSSTSGLSDTTLTQATTSADGTFTVRFGLPTQSGYLAPGDKLTLLVEATYFGEPRYFAMPLVYSSGHWALAVSPHSNPPYLYLDVATKTAHYTAP